MSDLMDAHERIRFRAAARHAINRYPGPAGQILSREILAVEDFGHRLGRAAQVRLLVDQLMTEPATPAPQPPEPGVVHLRVDIPGQT